MRELVGWAVAARHRARRRAAHRTGRRDPARRRRSSAWTGSPTTCSRACAPTRRRSSARPTGTATCSRSPAPASRSGASCSSELGGFDERFVLCGSDVALGLDAVLAGKRNVCTPFAGVRHLESATRGTDVVPADDFFASYWRYQNWVIAGDPYFSPNLSLDSLGTTAALAVRDDAARAASPTARAHARRCSGCRATPRKRRCSRPRSASPTPTRERSTALHAAARGAVAAPKTINWFLPDIDSPFYGGINTALRIADHLARTHGVENRFVVLGRAERGVLPLGDRRRVPRARRLARSRSTTRRSRRSNCCPKPTRRSRRCG